MQTKPPDAEINKLGERAINFLKRRDRGDLVLEVDSTYEDGIADTLGWLFSDGGRPEVN